jgi:hypothetical protein
MFLATVGFSTAAWVRWHVRSIAKDHVASTAPPGGVGQPAGGNRRESLVDARSANTSPQASTTAPGQGRVGEPGMPRRFNGQGNRRRPRTTRPEDQRPSNQPPKSSPDGDALAYRAFAESISDSFDGAEHQETLAVPRRQAPPKPLPSMDAPIQPKEKDLNTVLVAVEQQYESARKQIDQTRRKAGNKLGRAFDQSNKMMQSATDLALSGKLTAHSTEREYAGRIGGAPAYREVERETNYGIFAAIGAGLAAGKMQSEAMKADYKARIEAEKQIESARVAAWRALTPHLSEFYANVAAAGSGRDVLSLQISRGTPDERPGMVAINISGRTLTHVTILTKIVHFESQPSSMVDQWFYIPEWEPQRKIELLGSYVPNIESDDLRKRTDLGAMPSQSYEDSSVGLAGGALRATVQMYCSQLAVQPTEFAFPENAPRAASWELDAACRILLEGMFAEESRAEAERLRKTPVINAPGLNNVRVKAPNVGLPLMPRRMDPQQHPASLAIARQIVDHALAYVPDNSAEATGLRNFLNDPQASTRDYCRKLIAKAVSGVPLNIPLHGTWSAARATALMARSLGNVNSRMDLTIKGIDADGEHITATLENPSFPGESQKYIGRLTRQAASDNTRQQSIGRSVVLHLEPVSPVNATGHKLTADTVQHPANWADLELTIQERGFHGTGTLWGDFQVVPPIHSIPVEVTFPF